MDGGIRRPSVTLIAGLAISALAGLVVAFFFWSAGPLSFVVAAVLAITPGMLLLAAILALDRLEPEPRLNLFFAFAWGAGTAVLLAGIFNELGGELVFGDPFTAGTAVLVAPIVEETLKGAALLILLWSRRLEIDGPTDGIIYAATVGLGFAITEDIQYYMATLAEGDPSGTLMVVIMRGVISPLNHSLFTSMIGLGVAYAATRHGAARILVIGAGWAAAMILHALWNTMATIGGLEGLSMAWLILLVVLIILVVVVLIERRRLVGEIWRYLPQYPGVTRGEVEMLASLKGRRRARQWARQGGRGPARAMGDLQVAATELVLLHRRADRGHVAPGTFETWRSGLLQVMGSARSALSRMSTVRQWPPPG